MTTAHTKFAVRWLGRLVGGAVLAVIVAALAVLTVIPRAVHGSALTVLTGSMTPGIPVGSTVVVRPVDPGTLRVGDVATYQKTPSQPEYITHRIVAIDTTTDPLTFTFKGDANRGPDLDPVPATAIRGKVWFHVPYLGTFRDTLHTKGGMAGAGILVLGGYAVYQFADVLRDRRKKKAGVLAGRGDGEAISGLVPAAGITAANDMLVLVKLPIAALEGMSPRLFATLMRAALIDGEPGGETCTLLISDSTEAAQRTVALLAVLDPIEVRTPDALDAIPSVASSDSLDIGPVDA